MSRFYKVLLWITNVTSVVCLLLVMGSVIHLGWLSVETKSWQQAIDQELAGEQLNGRLPSTTEGGPGAAAPLTAEQKAELQQSMAGARTLLLAEIHAADADERAILDRLITLVGVFSAILGLCAFATVKLAREDAQAQQNRIKADLEDFKASSKTDLENFKTSIWSELPEMRNLKDSLRDLMLDLDRTIPREADWNEELSYSHLNVLERERILIAESTVNALQIFVSRNSSANVATQANLYRTLARFYFGRFRAKKEEEDAERADIYARKAGELEPNNSTTDRLRGSIFLAQYRILKEKIAEQAKAKQAGAQSGAPQQVEAKPDLERLESLLTAAVDFLEDAMEKDGSDAGAALNLALAARYREQFDKAIEISEKAIANRGKMSDQRVLKYLPSLYLNLACYHARRADKPGSDSQKERKAAVGVLSAGMQYLQDRKNSGAVDSLCTKINNEKGRDDAFKNLGDENIAALDALIATAQKKN